jgi:hypothetical protein
MISLPNVNTIKEGWKGDNSIWNSITNEASRKIYVEREQECIANKSVSAL